MSHKRFTESDALKLHQLDLLRRIATDPQADEGSSEHAAPRGEVGETTVAEWGLSAEVKPYPWQEAALAAWEKAGRTGIVKVVTGAGKTVFALLCLERLLREDTDIRASIIVPTRVLLDQWYDELTGTLNMPAAWVGRRSGEYSDRFDGDRRVMIYVINSARHALGEPLSDGHLGDHHFLIVDECHRAGSKENARIFERPKAFALGLSATPDRDYEDAAGEASEDEEVPGEVQTALGEIVYELSFGEALKEGIIPPFELIHLAVHLTGKERADYDQLSREIDKVRDELEGHPQFMKRSGRGANKFQMIKWFSTRGKGPISKLAARYESLTSRRKELLYRAENRRACFRDILERERSEGTRVMAFHERVSEVNNLYAEFMREGLPVVLDHSELTQTQREESLRLYLRGVAPILLSVKALIEGVNAPATDVGVIVAASSSPRQKIQSIGRVLRTYPGKDMSRIFNIYVESSADEYIFKQVSWERLLGAGRTEYRRWKGPGEWQELEGPPFEPLPTETDIQRNDLTTGEPYPGEYEGQEMSLDTQGNVFRDVVTEGQPARQFSRLPDDVVDHILQIRDRGGPLRVTPERMYVLVRAQNAEGEWQTFFAGQLSEPPAWETRDENRIPLSVSQKHGGSLVRKGGRSTFFDNKSPAARKILNAVKAFGRERGTQVHKIEIAESGEVFARVGGYETRIIKLETDDGFPFGKASFTDLRKEVEDDSEGR